MIVCVDIGGGTTRVGFSSDGESFDDIVKFETQEEFDNEISQIIYEIKNKTEDAEKISIAAPGTVDRENGALVSWGQKHSWWGKSFFAPLKSNFPNATLKFEHDADVAALGESYFGSGQNYSNFGFVTLSTGIGGALIENGKLDRVSKDNEIGHLIINSDEREEWSCGQKGCWESYASGTAFKKIFGLNPEDCEDFGVWAKYAKNVSPGIANMMLIWRPEAILIGGGVSGKFDSFINPLREEVKISLGTYSNLLCDIVKAELNEPGLYGGLVL